mmetsp:Transcript_109760/g.321328  ORF Transcript_109760/g.321328 Transcript_109760/m.321328 type:complete len:400 (+) Transcript_109760:163-1362(+)
MHIGHPTLARLPVARCPRLHSQAPLPLRCPMPSSRDLCPQAAAAMLPAATKVRRQGLASDWMATGRPRGLGAALCGAYVLLSASGPVLLDWVRRHHGGSFPFSIPALTFHAYFAASMMGAMWALSQGRSGLKKLARPDMLWRFCITTSLFTVGDMLSFMSLQHLDVGTFSLVGKACAIVLTVLLARVVLRRRQTRLQYTLVALVAMATVVFCRSEMHARHLVTGHAHASGLSQLKQASEWQLVGLTQRIAAVGFTSLAAVIQERLLTKEPKLSFLLQQCWMGCGAMATSLVALRCVYGMPISALWQGFGDWRVLLLLVMYVANGLAAGLMVKCLGAVAKALCVPIYLGFCYAYAVQSGSAVLTLQVIATWVVSTLCILLYAMTSAMSAQAARQSQALPK